MRHDASQKGERSLVRLFSGGCCLAFSLLFAVCIGCGKNSNQSNSSPPVPVAGTAATPVPPPAPNADPAAYHALLLAGDKLLNEGTLAEALSVAKTAIAMDGSRYEAYALAAVIDTKAGKSDEASKYIAKAQELVPADKKDRLAGAIAYVKAGAAQPPVISNQSTSAGNPVVSVNPPAAQVGGPPFTALSGEARVKYNTLTLIAADIDKAKPGEERTKLLREFMDKSAEFLELAPNRADILVMRAALALELEDAHAGWEAGRKLTALGAGNSDDPKIQKVMAKLERKGWLAETDPVVKASEARQKLLDDFAGTWNFLHSGNRCNTTASSGNEETEYTLNSFTLANSGDQDLVLAGYSRAFTSSTLSGVYAGSKYQQTEIYPPGESTLIWASLVSSGQAINASPNSWIFSFNTQFFPEKRLILVAQIINASTNSYFLALDQTGTKLVKIDLVDKSDADPPWSVSDRSQITGELIDRLAKLHGTTRNVRSKSGSVSISPELTYAIKVKP
jgi:tetratricopeptide (TPR) repeat protein